VTYRELADAVERSSSALAARGVSRGDRVALLDDTSLLHVATILGTARIGAAAVPMHVQLSASEVGSLIANCGCSAVGVAGKAYAERLSEGLGRSAVAEAELLGPSSAATPEAVDAPELPCVVLLTSGTTGLPKPVPISHRTLVPRMQAFAAAFDPARPAPRSIMSVPNVHIGGLGGLLSGLAGGATIVVLPRFEAGAWLAAVEAQRVNTTFLVPAMIRRILAHPRFEATDLSSLRAVSYGAAPATGDLVEEMIRRFPKHVLFANVYGQTETTGAITSFGPDDHRLDERGRLPRAGSVGRPLPGVELRFVDSDTGADLPAGEPGELWVRSPFNAETGWRKTGDIVRQDADGYLFPIGRLSDTINRGGEKFGPAEVEAALRAHPQVADVAVAGIPDPELGERVGAAIVRRGELSADEVRDHCRERIARFKLPEWIAFVDEIPHTALYKTSRKQIAALIQREGARVPQR
jgi:long-chain acyl-CoA synthetase